MMIFTNTIGVFLVINQFPQYLAVGLVEEFIFVAVGLLFFICGLKRIGFRDFVAYFSRGSTQHQKPVEQQIRVIDQKPLKPQINAIELENTIFEFLKNNEKKAFTISSIMNRISFEKSAQITSELVGKSLEELIKKGRVQQTQKDNVTFYNY